MTKKFLSLVLTGLLLNLFFFAPVRANNLEKEAKAARKVKSEIARLGSGTQTNIKVKLRDKSKLQGYIGGINEDSFTVVDQQTNNSTTVPYSKVKKAWGNNYSTGQKILIGIGIAYFVLMLIAFASTDEF